MSVTLINEYWFTPHISLQLQTRFGRKQPEILPQHGTMDGIMPSDGRRKKSGTTAHLAGDIDRAQKFRERARTVAAGRPKFKISRKGRSFKMELSPSLLEKHQFGDKITFRRISEDRTSSFSAYSITDVESRGGAMGDHSAQSGVCDEEMSLTSLEQRMTIHHVEECGEESS